MTEQNKTTLIIGGGIAGLSAALSLANLGLGSVIIEKNEELGGHLKDHHVLFPHQTNASEVLSEKLEQAQNNMLIDIRNNSAVTAVDGEFGAFKITVKNDKDGGGEDRLAVGAIIIATGFVGMDTNNIYEYSYSLHKNIITGLEFEKLITDNVKAGEKFGRPSDGVAPKSAAIIMCTGSRDEKHNLFCCEVGCRAGLNHADYLKDTFGKDIEVIICYIDIRATGKDNEDFYKRVREKDVHMIKSRPSEILAVDDHFARFNVFDLITHKLLQIEADLIILETALEPPESQGKLNELLKLEVDDTGFISLPDYFKQYRSTVKGVFLAGTVTGPGDLPGTIATAALAANEIAKIFK